MTNAVPILLGKGRCQLSTSYTDLPRLADHRRKSEADQSIDEHVVGFGAVVWQIYKTREAEFGKNWGRMGDDRLQKESKKLQWQIVRHKAELKEDKEGCQWFLKACRNNRLAEGFLDATRAKNKKRLYMYRSGGSLDQLQTSVKGGIAVKAECLLFAGIVLVMLRYLSGCTSATEEPFEFVPGWIAFDDEMCVDLADASLKETQRHDRQDFAKMLEHSSKTQCDAFFTFYWLLLEEVKASGRA